MNLYLTADRVKAPTGGGLVTQQELEAFFKMPGPCEVLSREQLGQCEDPWGWDDAAENRLKFWIWKNRENISFDNYKLCHGYSGSFGKTIKLLKENGCQVCWTIAAHDREVSRREHEKLGLSFPYTHLTEEALWQRYIEGYRLADVIVCPSTVAEKTVRAYGPEFERKRIEVIPHGCTLPTSISQLPTTFTVGYLGSFGADKGVRYLLEAWKKLNLKDAVLMLGGRDSITPWAAHLIQTYGGGNIWRVGWVDDVSQFYSKISLYVQPSATEGFGIEVLEAMANGRSVICSRGAGAQDVVPEPYRVDACDSDQLASAINSFRKLDWQVDGGWKKEAENYTWDKIRQRYIDLWKTML